MSQGIVHSIMFTTKLIIEMEKQLDMRVGDIAEALVSREQRLNWLTITSENAVETYIKNMQFTVHFLEALKQQYGQRVVDITNELVAQEEEMRWSAVAQYQDEHSIEQFMQLVWEPLKALGFQFTTEKRSNGTQLHCTSCPIHELSKVIGGAEWLAILECNKDLHNVKGFNPKIGFSRTKTLIKGDSHCDHFYYEKVD